MLTCILIAIVLLAAPGAQAQDMFAESGDRFGYAVAHGDFNDDGFEDLAVGVADEGITNTPAPPIARAGAVDVIYGTVYGLRPTNRQLWRQGGGGIGDAAEAGDRFGRSLAVGDFNKDGYDDLAIGVPYEDLGNVVDAGAVHVLYGSPTGLSTTSVADQFWHQNKAGIPDRVEAHDLFGYTLTAADFNADGYDDLAVGSWENGPGIAHVIYGSNNGLSAQTVPAQRWYQGGHGLGDVPEPSDWFGLSLAAADFNNDGYADLAIGTAHENNDSGIVQVVHGSPIGLSATVIPDQLWAQGRRGMPGVAESSDLFGTALAAGDFNRDGYGDLAIGVPGQTVNGMEDAGEVNVLYGSPLGLSTTAVRPAQVWRQGVWVADAAERSDSFGSSLTAGDFDGDGFADLAIAAPLEDIGVIADAGAVNVLYGSGSGLSIASNQFWHQNTENVKGIAGGGDAFGWALTAGDFDGNASDDLAVGVVNEDLYKANGALSDAGAVNLLYGSYYGLTAIANAVWTQTLILPPQP